ncbi:insulin-induced protein [Xylariomycetidae sp. FL2044]|nr:insulin-induced protein [Xylariomycetidae sp. FL2044]
MTDSPDGPPVFRPIPRRPFNVNLREPTPPIDGDDDYDGPFAASPGAHGPLNLDHLNSKLLVDPVRTSRGNGSESTSISRAQSVLNLTSSTLMGIYSPTVTATSNSPRGYPTYSPYSSTYPGEDPSTPWGTGAETPAITDDGTRAKLQQRQRQRRRSSLPARRQRLSLFQLTLRGVLLAGLGVGYGMLVAQVRRDTSSSSTSPEIESGYMAFWGMVGVVLGSLLPWFDGVWEGAFGTGDEDDVVVESDDDKRRVGGAGTDWALAIRGIGAFAGIAFAIRKLPWDSSLQISLTLALVNPVLWFLIDRSMPGFLVSTGVGLTGSAMLMGLKPDMLPNPSFTSSSFSSSCPTPSSSLLYGYQNDSSASMGSGESPLMLGGLATQESVASGIWMVSVLSCCCVCFGNLGRWLMANDGGVVRGRWAERK